MGFGGWFSWQVFTWILFIGTTFIIGKIMNKKESIKQVKSMMGLLLGVVIVGVIIPHILSKDATMPSIMPTISGIISGIIMVILFKVLTLREKKNNK